LLGEKDVDNEDCVIEQYPMQYSASTCPELSNWLRGASDSGEAPGFIRAIADAALLAGLNDYAFLRPLLLELLRDAGSWPGRGVS
jgi:hypothetical protein